MRIALLIVVAGLLATLSGAQTTGVPGANDFRTAIDGGALTAPGQTSCIHTKLPAGRRQFSATESAARHRLCERAASTRLIPVVAGAMSLITA